MVARHEACVGGCLSCAIELFGGPELAYHDRSGLKPYSRNRVQKRASPLQLRILLDVLFDLLI